MVPCFAPAVVMDARNSCGHDTRVEACEDWLYASFSASSDSGNIWPPSTMIVWPVT